jgi:hypothetical protein
VTKKAGILVERLVRVVGTDVEDGSVRQDNGEVGQGLLVVAGRHRHDGIREGRAAVRGVGDEAVARVGIARALARQPIPADVDAPVEGLAGKSSP